MDTFRSKRWPLLWPWEGALGQSLGASWLPGEQVPGHPEGSKACRGGRWRVPRGKGPEAIQPPKNCSLSRSPVEERGEQRTCLGFFTTGSI